MPDLEWSHFTMIKLNYFRLKYYFIYITLLIFTFYVAPVFSQYERIEYSTHSDTIAASDIIPADIDSVYNYISSLSSLIDFDDCNICKSRVHIISRIVEKKFPNIVIAKAWLIADCKRNSQKEIYKYKPHVYLRSGNECSKWAYHVAPVIITSLDTFIIDPSTQSGAVTLRKWAGNIIPTRGKGFIIIKDKRYYIYPQKFADLFEDKLPAWNENNPALTDDKYLRSIDETLQAKHGFYDPWKFNYYISQLMQMLE